ncbi:MAG TPA: hypothetical protein VK212_09245 [Lentimicrobium sp.]|nr:hypothetical protein [Lentimicrobium sp.]
MKTFFTLLLTFLICGFANAQLEKGTWITSLHGSGNYLSKSEYKLTRLTLTPAIMRLIDNNLALGINLSTSFGSDRIPIVSNPYSVNKTQTYSLEAGPVIRKYFGDGRFKPYGELGIGWHYVSVREQENDRPIYKDHNDYLYARPVIGLSYWITEQISVDINTGLNAVFNLEPDYLYKDWNLNIGIAVKLGKKNDE